MSEPIPASIRIGGVLTPDQLIELVDAIEDDGALIGNAGLAPSAEAIRVCTSEGQRPLLVQNSHAVWGEFPLIERRCQRLRLTYIRICRAEGEYNGELVYWQPGQQTPMLLYATQDGEPYLMRGELEQIRDEHGSLDDALAELQVPDVPPLSILETSTSAV